MLSYSAFDSALSSSSSSISFWYPIFKYWISYPWLQPSWQQQDLIRLIFLDKDHLLIWLHIRFCLCLQELILYHKKQYQHCRHLRNLYSKHHLPFILQNICPPNHEEFIIVYLMGLQLQAITRWYRIMFFRIELRQFCEFIEYILSQSYRIRLWRGLATLMSSLINIIVGLSDYFKNHFFSRFHS